MTQVTITEGVLEGEIVNNEYGGTYYSFKGIPYAKPPVGDLRFKAPQPPKSWQGIRSAKEFGPKCIQFNLFTRAGIEGSEDCLYLNVYTPDVKPEKPLPVMFWLHGGGYMSGSGEEDFYGPQFLVNKDVVVVTINYRLEVLGFLCLNTKEIPGNAGLKDQVEALRWVNRNISNFGGDPNNVTIFGESAGGTSVSYHTISPLSKGLFKRAIAQSGAPLCNWSFTEQPRERALAFARKLDFFSEDDQELYEFFKKLPVESLIQVQAPLYLSEKSKGLAMIFTVADEKDVGGDGRFFYGDMIKAISNNVHEGVEIMTGFTTDEGLIGLGSKELTDQRLELSRNFPEIFVSGSLLLNLPLKKQLEIGTRIRQRYFKNSESFGDWKNLAEYMSFDMFVFGIVRWAKLCSKNNKNKVYLYRFSCKSERNVIANVFALGDIIGATPVTCHADDVMYLFAPKVMNTVVDSKSLAYKLIDRVTTLWTNFAKYGNPTPDESLGVKWTPYSVEDQDFLDIGNELVAGTAPYDEEIQFWENIYRDCGQRLYE